uniref:Endonuclease/exonuclease/phosphatase domain-containing protein n=1 Tax=Lactuca sativa TaxID=4236 RepID=A0A9R1UK62_LACSA|nr:hypothetical protein LSAT_V11C900486800 [Lactuca sativa]
MLASSLLEGVSLETLVFKVVLLFVGLQEIKSMEVKDSLDRQIWGSSTFQCEVIDPMGLSVGIASLWDPSLFNATDSIKGEAFLAIRGMWLRTIEKRTLWNNLFNLINSNLDYCWFVFGDFNVVRLPKERLGSIFCQNSVCHFNKFTYSLGLLETKVGGRRFTYMSSVGDKHDKLDRYLVSPNFIDA